MGVDIRRLASHRSKGAAIDCQYSDYSMHYNLCSQMAKQIEELHAGITSTKYLHLKQQFNAQFNKAQLAMTMKSSRTSPTSSAVNYQEMGMNFVERLRKASEPLRPSDYGGDDLAEEKDNDAISDGMESVASLNDESDWQTVRDDYQSDEEETTSFASIRISSDSGRNGYSIVLS